MDRHKPSPRLRGFTLVELLVTLAVVGILVAALYQIFIGQQRSYSLQEEVADAQQNARVAVAELTRSLASLGAGAELERGQVRLLVAHPHQIVFNADLRTDKGALAPGAAVPGALASDPYQTVPAGTFAVHPNPGAETYRYTLDRNGDNRVTSADRTQGEHYTLYREINGGNNEELATLVANPRIAEPLFRYWGDFDGDGDGEFVDRVDATTSPRVAAGEPLDAVVRRVEVNLVAETATPDPRFPQNMGYRQTRLRTVLSPENLWDCPVVSLFDNPLVPPVRGPQLQGTTTEFKFRVTRGGSPEQGRTVVFSAQDPSGTPLTITNRGTTDANGVVSGFLSWPAGCGAVPTGTYLVRARTAEPPTFSTPYGTCSPHEATLALTVIEGLPFHVVFSPALLSVSSCGGSETTNYAILDACNRPVRPQDVADDQFSLTLGPDPGFFARLTPLVLNQPQGTITYESPGGDYGRFAVPRSAVAPNPFQSLITATDRAGHTGGTLPIEVRQAPSSLVGLSHNTAPPMADCPSPVLPVQETFTVEDSCGNPLWSLSGTGFAVTARLVAGTLPGWPVPNQGAIASPGNRAAFAPSSIPVVNHGGTPGEFAVQYRPPTCTLGGFSFFPQLTLTPSWPGAGTQTLPLRLDPCGGCSVQVLNAAGAAVTTLNKECEGAYDLVITECVPVGTQVEVVVGRVGGSGMLSFDRNGSQDRVTLTFNAGRSGQTARDRLFVGSAQTGAQFRVAAFIPSQAAVQAGNGVMCQSELLTVDSRCSEILISPVSDNPRNVPQNLPASETPLCAVDGSPVYFRVMDCDQNIRDAAFDDIQVAAGANQGLFVEVVDASTGAVLDQEAPDLLESDIHGTRSSDSPYFQGVLPVTSDPADGSFSGRLAAPQDRISLLRVRYSDPDDPADSLCAAEALLVPPLPLCLARPLLAGGSWDGPLSVHGGDAVVAGDLALPNTPGLIAKDQGATPSSQPYTPPPADRFFNAYVGGTLSVGGTPLPPLGPVDQPFLPGGAGAPFATDMGNYFQAVSDTASLLSPLDYETLKQLASAWKVYWVAEAGGTIFNPATLQRGTFEEVTRLPGPGLPSATHDGRFLFVDAPAVLQGGGRVDQTPVALLPRHEVSGDYYTEGLLYVAGSVAFGASSGQQSVPLEAVVGFDSRYDENAGGFVRQELPIDFAPPVVRAFVGNQTVNLNGALYCDGEVSLAPGFRIYGALAAERGGRSALDAEVWYDPRWREARASLCSQCCTLALSPTSPRVSLADTLQLIATGGRGARVWESLAPQVATVDQTGLVTPAAAGRVTIRALDAGGCVAEVEVEVF